jgi:hypothetical protein
MFEGLSSVFKFRNAAVGGRSQVKLQWPVLGQIAHGKI